MTVEEKVIEFPLEVRPHELMMAGIRGRKRFQGRSVLVKCIACMISRKRSPPKHCRITDYLLRKRQKERC